MKRFVSRLLMNWFVCALAAMCLTTVAFGQVWQQQKSPAKFFRTENSIVNRYIVVFNEQDKTIRKSRRRDQLVPVANSLAVAYSGTVEHVYSSALKGFSVEMSETQALALSQNKKVKYVVEDGVASLAFTQYNAPWGLDRIDQPNRPLSTTYNYTTTGAGVRAYVIDTGMLTWNREFGGRASIGADFVGDGQDGVDCHGHGTHVAGILAGNTYGVAKEARVIAVRVSGCSGGGPNSTLIAGIDWVRANAVRPAVANISISTGYSYPPLDEAVRNLINSGVTVVAGAGNDNGDAYYTSPARLREAITVGAADSNDNRASFSNFGSFVDVFAPGVEIESAWHTGYGATAIFSGTSMAAAHVSGVAALYLEINPNASPAVVSNAITTAAAQNRLSDIRPGSPNLLLQLTPNTNAPTPTMDPRVFDARWYLDLNPDVAAVYGSNNLEGAVSHWVNYGINEGRASSPAFQVREYLARYGDLQAAFGTNYRAAIEHWLRHGLSEGRRASPAFDAPDYLNRFVDLRDAYGATNYEAGLIHWLNPGLNNEGRRASAEFDAIYYLANNGDVAAVYGATNYRGAVSHWLVWGRNEGRRGAP